MAGRALLRIEEWVLDRVDRVASRTGRNGGMAPHLATGLKGEQAALFHLRREGYTVVARRWKTPKLRGDVDLIAWERDHLCFVEVKTRTRRDRMTPAETAVDRDKQTMLRRMAGVYVRGFPEEKRSDVVVRFDVVAVYLEGGRTEFELFRDAFR